MSFCVWMFSGEKLRHACDNGICRGFIEMGKGVAENRFAPKSPGESAIECRKTEQAFEGLAETLPARECKQHQDNDAQKKAHYNEHRRNFAPDTRLGSVWTRHGMRSAGLDDPPFRRSYRSTAYVRGQALPAVRLRGWARELLFWLAPRLTRPGQQGGAPDGERLQCRR